MAASEALPYAKSGGLADVVGALAAHLGPARPPGAPLRPVPPRDAARASRTCRGRVDAARPALPRPRRARRAAAPRAGARASPRYLVREDAAFDRPHLYGTPDGDYWDNAGRFALFCRAVARRPRRARRASRRRPRARLAGRARSRSTCATAPTSPAALAGHPVAPHGAQPRLPGDLSPLRARLRRRSPRTSSTCTGVEFYGELNLLKGGLLYADAITTVSPRYSEEIRTPAFGEGLDGVLRERAAALHGILNGVDYEAWNPETDPHLPARYGAADLAGQGALQGGARARLRPRRRTRGRRSSARSRAWPTRRASTCSPPRCPRLAALPPALRASSAPATGTTRTSSLDLGAAPPRPRRGADRLRRGPRPPDRGRRRLLPDALALRALRPQPALQPALRHDPGGARGRRASPTPSSTSTPPAARAPASSSATTTSSGLLWAVARGARGLRAPGGLGAAARATRWPRTSPGRPRRAATSSSTARLGRGAPPLARRTGADARHAARAPLGQAA